MWHTFISSIWPHRDTKQPLDQRWLLRFLVVLVIVFALAAGYYRSVLQIYHTQFVRLQTKYMLLEQRQR